MVGAAPPMLESGVRLAPPAVPRDCANTALISSELMYTSAFGGDETGPASGLAGVGNPLGADCWVAWSNCAIFCSNDWACSAMAAAGSGCATGAGFFRTRKMATSDATSVVMLMMRSSLSFFMATPAVGPRQARPVS